MTTRNADKVMAELQEQQRQQLSAPPTPRVTVLAAITEVRYNTLVVDMGGGATVEVIKPTKVCPAFDQGVDGYTYDYTADADEAQTRTSTSGASVETQAVVPAFVVGDLVEIGAAPSNVATHAAGLAAHNWQVVNSPCYWSKTGGG